MFVGRQPGRPDGVWPSPNLRSARVACKCRTWYWRTKKNTGHDNGGPSCVAALLDELYVFMPNVRLLCDEWCQCLAAVKSHGRWKQQQRLWRVQQADGRRVGWRRWRSSARGFQCSNITTRCTVGRNTGALTAWCFMVVTHSQETCTSQLVQETWPSDMVSCTRFFLYKFLAPNTAQLYSIQETCIHMTRMVSSDWLAAYHCHVFILLCWCCWQFVVQS